MAAGETLTEVCETDLGSIDAEDMAMVDAVDGASPAVPAIEEAGLASNAAQSLATSHSEIPGNGSAVVEASVSGLASAPENLTQIDHLNALECRWEGDDRAVLLGTLYSYEHAAELSVLLIEMGVDRTTLLVPGITVVFERSQYGERNMNYTVSRDPDSFELDEAPTDAGMAAADLQASLCESGENARLDASNLADKPVTKPAAQRAAKPTTQRAAKRPRSAAATSNRAPPAPPLPLRSGRVSKRPLTLEDAGASTIDGPARAFATAPAASAGKKPRVSLVHPLPVYAVQGARVVALGSLGGTHVPFIAEIIEVLSGQRVHVRFLSDSDGHTARICLPMIPTAYVGADALLGVSTA